MADAFPTCLARATWLAADLYDRHPPRPRHPYKRLLLDVAVPPGAAVGGTVHFARWAAAAVPSTVPVAVPTVDVRADVYDYATVDPKAVEWHVNFADPDLFCAYAGGLFAQDEMQVAEHPVLASVRERLMAASPLDAGTVDGRDPTPITIRGVERRIAVATDVTPDRPRGLYGNGFAKADAETIRRATRVIDPPTVTNLIAIAAPSGGHGVYSAADVDGILSTAYTAFAAAAAESGSSPTVVHTGFWGCGAFGGNRTLMPLLQLLAARLAGVGRVAFHATSPAGRVTFGESVVLLDRLTAKHRTTDDVVTAVVGQAFRWGVSDGN